ncbi:UDP-glycosyltransferase, partial [Bacteroidota bacterium]
MKKIFVFLPDGVGLRNFAFTKFNDVGELNKLETVYWNNTDFDLSSIGLKEIKIKNSKSTALS